MIPSSRELTRTLTLLRQINRESSKLSGTPRPSATKKPRPKRPYRRGATAAVTRVMRRAKGTLRLTTIAHRAKRSMGVTAAVLNRLPHVRRIGRGLYSM